jgi:hypothetical protein
MGQKTLKQPSIIIIWTYWRMLVWASRILFGVMDGDWQDLGSEVGQMQADFWHHPSHKSKSAHMKWARRLSNNH